MTCPIGKNLVLAPVRFAISDQATYQWEVDGQVQSGQTSIYFDFTPSVQGKTYVVKVTAKDGDKTATATVNVGLCRSLRGLISGNLRQQVIIFPTIVMNLSRPPDQFIRFNQNQTAEDARMTVQTTLDNGGGTSWMVSLGAWGGYMILGFDHSVKDDGKGEADFDMVGNPLGKYWCECGVVWVSQDENGNGIPDDTWYELKGSETVNRELRSDMP